MDVESDWNRKLDMAASTFNTRAAADELRAAGFDEKQARANHRDRYLAGDPMPAKLGQ